MPIAPKEAPPAPEDDRRSQQSAAISHARLIQILQAALPNRVLRSFARLEGGASNLNYLLRFDGSEAPLVLRIYTRDPSACIKELRVLRSAARCLPVPEIVAFNPTGERDIAPYVVYRFAEGITFQELKSHGNLQDLAEAAYAVGAALARVQTVAIPPPEMSARPPAWREIMHDDSASFLLKQRIGTAEVGRLRTFLSAWSPELSQLYEPRALVHGDFNNRNTILRQDRGRWIVSAILDWELAFLGSPLWDAARFICYENQHRPCREPHFSRGFREAGGNLPDNWSHFSRVINILSAAESLSRPDLPESFVPELCELIVRLPAMPGTVRAGV